MENSPTRARPWLLALAVALVTVVAFQPAFDGQWLHWDDDKNFVENDAWRGLSAESVRWMLTTFHQGPYQPLSWLTLGAEYELWGSDPRGYHVTNVVIHALAAVAFLFFARALFQRIAALRAAPGFVIDCAAALAAALFAVHPLRVESVAWVTERRDVLSGLFLALCCWAYVVGVTSAGSARKRALVASTVLYALSLAAKGSGFPLPLALIALDALVLGRWNKQLAGPATEKGRSLTGLVLEKWCFIALALIAAWLAWKGQSGHASMRTLEMYGLGSRIVQSFYGLWFYAWKTLWPADLIPLVPLPAVARPFEPRFAIAIMAVLATAALAWILRRRAPALGAALLAYAVLVLPVLGLTQAGPQLVADRYSYLPCLPLVLLVAGAAARLAVARPERGRAVLFALAILAVVLVPLTRAQSRVWRNDATLWEKTVAVRPDDAPAWRNLSMAYLRPAESESDALRAKALYESTIAVCKNGLELVLDAGLLSNAASAHRGLSAVDPEQRQQHLQTAFEFARRAVERSDMEEKPTKFAYVNYGLIAIELERPALAIPAFTWYADHYPDDPEGQLRLAQTLSLAGRPREALAVFDATLKLAPYSPRVWMEKGEAHRALGEQAQAIAHFERGIKLAESLPSELAEDPAVVESWRALLARQKQP